MIINQNTITETSTSILPNTIGIIGFGEVGKIISEGIAKSSEFRVTIYDKILDNEDQKNSTIKKIQDLGANVSNSVGDLINQSQFVLSIVTSSTALTVASEVASLLGLKHVYFDLNSVSPEIKKQIGCSIESSGAKFVEGAIMASVSKIGFRVPILACGGKTAVELSSKLNNCGMNIRYIGAEFGRAAATKMFRSIIAKGLEAIIIECLLAASRHNVCDEVLEYVEQGYPGLGWHETADFLVGRSVLHGVRRAHEMTEVCETLKKMDIEPFMSSAAAKRLTSFAEHNLKARFPDGTPNSFKQVLTEINRLTHSSDQRP